MGDTSFVRDKFSSLSTEVLTEMWVTEQREPWAHAILLQELLERGASEQWLMSLSNHRELISEKLSAERSFERWLWITGAIASSGVGGFLVFGTEMGGEKGALWAGLLLSAAYLFALSRMIFLARHEILERIQFRVILWFGLQLIIAMSFLAACAFFLGAKA